MTPDALAPRRPCMMCNRPTLVTMLSQYGARCFGCYESWCREPQRKVDVGDRSLDSKAWAHALQRRELAGDRLSITQKTMWRTALKYREPPPAEDQPTKKDVPHDVPGRPVNETRLP